MSSYRDLAADARRLADAKERAAKTPASRAVPVDDDRVPAEAVNKSLHDSFGYSHIGEFAKDVVAARVNKEMPERMRKRFAADTVKKAAQGMGELVGSDGGFLVPPTFSQKIFERVYAYDELLVRTDQYTCDGNSMVFPRNAETSRATGSRWGGVRAYWVQEGGVITASRPTFGRLTLNLHKLACIAAVTEELLQDSGMALNAYLNRVFPSEISFLANNAIFRGTGSGQPLGVLNADCKVSVAKESGQPAATITFANVVKMWARRFTGGGGNKNYVWFINQDVLPQLYQLSLAVGTGGLPAFMPPGGLSQQPYMTLFGAPIIETEYSSTLGTEGDIALVDLSRYVTITKTGGVQTAQSMHLYFDTDEQAFRTTFRLDGQPWWPAALQPFQGTNTQSPIVTLAARS